MKHLDDEALSAYSLDGEAAPEVETHLNECEVCRDGVSVYREIERALRGSHTWTTVDKAAEPDSRVSAILEYRRRKEEEEREARAFLARVIGSPLKFRNANVAAKPRYQTEGMVRVLCTEANARHEQRPKFSEQIAAAAYAVATKLTNVSEREKRGLMGMALREHANALRYLGRFKDALKLLDYAEKLFVGTPSTDPFDQAIVKYIRATVLMEVERVDAASRLAHEAVVVFREYGDVSRELAAVMVEACCFVHAGKPQTAVESFERAIGICRAKGDTPMLARALSNCAMALKDLRQFDTAERYCIEAVTLYDEFEMPTEKTRTEWIFAIIQFSRGEYLESAKRLAAIQRDLGKLGLTNDATLATLMWAEARLAVDRPNGVAETCRNLVVMFENEEMHRYAMRALAVLKEALAAGRATPKLVHEVRVYLEELPRTTLQPFNFAQ